MSEPAQSLRKKWIEPVVAVLMALTTLCTAWCSYESNALERSAALLDVQGSQALIVHASMFMQLLAAQHSGNEKLASSFLPSYECSLCLRPNELSFRILQNQTHS